MSRRSRIAQIQLTSRKLQIVYKKVLLIGVVVCLCVFICFCLFVAYQFIIIIIIIITIIIIIIIIITVAVYSEIYITNISTFH